MCFWPVRQRIAELERAGWTRSRIATTAGVQRPRSPASGNAPPAWPFAVVDRIRLGRSGPRHDRGPVPRKDHASGLTPADAAGVEREPRVSQTQSAEPTDTPLGTATAGFRRPRERRRQLPRSVVQPVVLVLTPHPRSSQLTARNPGHTGASIRPGALQWPASRPEPAFGVFVNQVGSQLAVAHRITLAHRLRAALYPAFVRGEPVGAGVGGMTVVGEA